MSGQALELANVQNNPGTVLNVSHAFAALELVSIALFFLKKKICITLFQQLLLQMINLGFLFCHLIYLGLKAVTPSLSFHEDGL